MSEVSPSTSSTYRWITDRDEWEWCLDVIGGYDFYNLPAFIFQEAELLSGIPKAFFYESGDFRALFPVIVRDIPRQEGKWQDALSPYGYPGLLSQDDRRTPEVLAAYGAAAAEARLVSTFVRLHPIHNTTLIPEAPGLQQSLRGKTYSIYLPDGTDAIQANYSSNHKRNLKKLVKQGFTVMVDAWEHLPVWQKIYLETMTRRGASEYYNFDLAYFENLRINLNCRFVVVLDAEGEVACGGIFTYYADVIQYHLGGTAEAYLKVAPSKLMFHAVIESAAEEGHYTWLHLGGGVGGQEDNLARFKKGFGNREHWFRSLEMIHQKDLYKSLSAGKEDTGWFPLYRKP